MKAVSTNKAPAAIGPYSQAQIVGNLVYTSGQIPIIPETGALAEGLEAQAHQVFKNLGELLKAAGSDLSKTVKTTVFIKNMNDFGAINAIYASPSPSPPAPAWRSPDFPRTCCWSARSSRSCKTAPQKRKRPSVTDGLFLYDIHSSGAAASVSPVGSVVPITAAGSSYGSKG